MLSRADVQAMERQLEAINGPLGTYTKQTSGAVYFVREADGPIKIGWAANPLRRMASMQSGNPRRLDMLAMLPCPRAEERALHERFDDLRLTGEWFRPEPALLAFIADLDSPHR